MRSPSLLPIFALSLALFASAAACGPAEPSATSDSSTAGTGGASAGGSTTGGATGGTSSGGSQTGGSTTGTGGMECTPPAPQGAPIDAPGGQFTWVPFQDAVCANGAPTGIAINPAPGAKRLFIYIMGGGACWNKDTCYDNPIAANIASGFGEKEFAQAGIGAAWFFDRKSPKNPFANDNLVFVPYCTGDVHSGTRVANYEGKPTAHVGALNMMAYLKRLAATFPAAEHVVVSGGSAGGIGAALNWHRVKDAFPCARVDMIDDAAAILPPPFFKADLQKTWRDAWGTDAALPADCAACKQDLDAIYAYSAAKSSNGRGAVMVGLNDSVVSFFFQLSTAQVEDSLLALAKDTLAPIPNMRHYYVAGDHHGVFDPSFAQNGVPVPTWVQQMLNDDPAWQNVAPANCAAAMTCQDCQTCALNGPCAKETDTCKANPECLAVFDCAGKCNNDQACIKTCTDQHPNGVADATAVIQCLGNGVCTGTCP